MQFLYYVENLRALRYKASYVFLKGPLEPIWLTWITLNSLRPRQKGRYFPDIFRCIFLYENVWILIKVSLKVVAEGPINNIPALVQIMAWHQTGKNPLSEPIMVRLPTHI